MEDAERLFKDADAKKAKHSTAISSSSSASPSFLAASGNSPSMPPKVWAEPNATTVTTSANATTTMASPCRGSISPSRGATQASASSSSPLALSQTSVSASEDSPFMSSPRSSVSKALNATSKSTRSSMASPCRGSVSPSREATPTSAYSPLESASTSPSTSFLSTSAPTTSASAPLASASFSSRSKSVEVVDFLSLLPFSAASAQQTSPSSTQSPPSSGRLKQNTTPLSSFLSAQRLGEPTQSASQMSTTVATNLLSMLHPQAPTSVPIPPKSNITSREAYLAQLAKALVSLNMSHMPLMAEALAHVSSTPSSMPGNITRSSFAHQLQPTLTVDTSQTATLTFSPHDTSLPPLSSFHAQPLSAISAAFRSHAQPFNANATALGSHAQPLNASAASLGSNPQSMNATASTAALEMAHRTSCVVSLSKGFDFHPMETRRSPDGFLQLPEARTYNNASAVSSSSGTFAECSSGDMATSMSAPASAKSGDDTDADADLRIVPSLELPSLDIKFPDELLTLSTPMCTSADITDSGMLCSLI